MKIFLISLNLLVISFLIVQKNNVKRYYKNLYEFSLRERNQLEKQNVEYLTEISLSERETERLTEILKSLEQSLPFDKDLKDLKVTGRFGDFRGDHYHKGVDFPMEIGTPILAVHEGELIPKYDSLAGYVAKIINPKSGVEIKYFHLKDMPIPGPVEPGNIIGYVGSTGRSTGPHLHLEVWINGKPVDPITLLQIIKPQPQSNEQTIRRSINVPYDNGRDDLCWEKLFPIGFVRDSRYIS